MDLVILILAVLFWMQAWSIYQLHQLRKGQTTMAATQADLDTALTNIENQIQNLGTDLNKSLKDLTDNIAASGTPVDLSAEVSRIQAIGTALTQFDTEATGDDPGPTGDAPTS